MNGCSEVIHGLGEALERAIHAFFRLGLPSTGETCCLFTIIIRSETNRVHANRQSQDRLISNVTIAQIHATILAVLSHQVDSEILRVFQYPEFTVKCIAAFLVNTSSRHEDIPEFWAPNRMHFHVAFV